MFFKIQKQEQQNSIKSNTNILPHVKITMLNAESKHFENWQINSKKCTATKFVMPGAPDG